jgi:hypothetical protein
MLNCKGNHQPQRKVQVAGVVGNSYTCRSPDANVRMYGPPSDCKEKAEGEKTSLRKCIRPLVEHSAPGQDELRAYLSL